MPGDTGQEAARRRSPIFPRNERQLQMDSLRLVLAVARVTQVSSVVVVAVAQVLEREDLMAEQHSDDVVRWRTKKERGGGIRRLRD